MGEAIVATRPAVTRVSAETKAGSSATLACMVLAFCLFGTATVGFRWIGPVAQEVLATFRDAETQWIVLGCCAAYFVVFVALRRRVGCGWFRTSGKQNIWLAAGLALAIVRYALRYSWTGATTDPLVLLGGAALGQGAAVWAGWGREKLKVENGREKCKKQKAESRNERMGTVVGVFILLLVAAAVWQGEAGHVFQYRGQARWSGPWDNPNTFGVLMGVGVVLAVGRLAQRLKAKGQRLNAGVESVKSVAKTFLLVLAAGAMGVGLVKSYSRGAWVGTVMGLSYLGWEIWRIESRKQKGETANAEKLKTEMLKAGNHERHEKHESKETASSAALPCGSCSSWFSFLGRNKLALGVMVVSLGVIGFWSLRDTEHSLVRRALTVGNVNDFSWRKRVASYEGALQMMAERPWFGFGWNQPERVYDHYYRAAKIDEGMAIQLNDYFMLGMTLGIPALACFVMYVALSLTPKSKVQGPVSAGPTSAFSIQPLAFPAICRAGAVVLLVGFWFDGGLFKLATGATFWILLELGRED